MRFPFIFHSLVPCLYVFELHGVAVVVAGFAVWYAIIGRFPGYLAYVLLHYDWVGVIVGG